MRYIADQLSKSDADIVALQECWVSSDFSYIIRRNKKKFPYVKYFYSGMLAGSGLVIMSRFPMESANMQPYTINGRPSAFFRGDWYVGKGIATAVIRHPSGVPIELFNTHMHAPYGPGDASYVCHRTLQAWQMARQIRAAVERGHLVLAVGDFNSRPGSLTYELLTQRAGLRDSWTTFRGIEPDDIDVASLTPEQQIKILGVTCDSQLNTWRADRHISEAQRLDYCFHAPGISDIDDISVAFVDPVPGLGCSASDHFGLMVKIRMVPQVPEILNSGLQQYREERRPIQFAVDNYNSILTTIASYRPTAVAQQFWRLLHFWVSVVALIALHIGCFWISKGWPVFLVLLGSVVIAVTGVIDGLIGFLFGRFELRTLQEFEEEVSWELGLVMSTSAPDDATFVRKSVSASISSRPMKDDFGAT
ncbi:Endonuclease/exonuclease/phosphatase [Dipodascopsis uninucleata]